MPVTIKDIARIAGVSHTTVSRALHDSPLISPRTTQHIRKIASQLGYHPSVAARSLKTRRSQVLGVILSHIADPYFSEILQGIDDVAQSNGYSLFIASAQYNPAREDAIVRTMGEHRVDGVILCSPNFTQEQSRQLNSYGVPIVALNNQAEESFNFAIYHDDVDGSMQACRHLVELGHQRIGYIGNAASGRSNHDRLAGYQQVMQEAGLPLPVEYVHHVAGNEAEKGVEGASYFLSLSNPPSALICYNDWIAVGALKCIRQAGLSVPEDISVTGFDNIALSDFTQPPLTTIDQPKRSLGAEAAMMMLRQLQSEDPSAVSEPAIKKLQGRLIIRQSTTLARRGE